MAGNETTYTVGNAKFRIRERSNGTYTISYVGWMGNHSVGSARSLDEAYAKCREYARNNV